VVAVIGMSNNPSKPSYFIPKYLMDMGYTIIPINPKEEKILGKQTYKNLLNIPHNVEIVEIFRRSEYLPIHAQEAVKKGVKVFWMQNGIYNEEAINLVKEEHIIPIWNRCMMKEYNRLIMKK
jgi:predicted CoA-binding protein